MPIPVFPLPDPLLPHRIEHTRNKHSRAVYRDDTVIIRLARGLSARQEREHVEYLLKRMAGSVRKELTRTRIDPFRPLFHGSPSCTVALGDGRTYAFTLTPGARTRAKRTSDGWDIVIGPRVRKTALHRYLWNLLAHAERERLTRLVEQINDHTFRFSVRSVRIGYATSQWGSCSHRGDIMLNATLLIVPPALLEYVIVHELAHRQVRNHSASYWRLVLGAMPDYAKRRAALQKFRICSL
jgi:predicted metal-dependent hydrolase